MSVDEEVEDDGQFSTALFALIDVSLESAKNASIFNVCQITNKSETVIIAAYGIEVVLIDVFP